MVERIRRADVAAVVDDWKRGGASFVSRSNAGSYDGTVLVSNLGADAIQAGKPILITGLGLSELNDSDAYNAYLSRGVLLSGEALVGEQEENDIVAVAASGIEAGTIGRAHLPGCFGAWLDAEHNAEYSRVGMTEDGFCDSEDGQFEYVAGVGRFAVLRLADLTGGYDKFFLACVCGHERMSCNRWLYLFSSCEFDEDGKVKLNWKEYGWARNVYELGLQSVYGWDAIGLPHSYLQTRQNSEKNSVLPVLPGTLVWMRKCDNLYQDRLLSNYIFHSANKEGNCVFISSRAEHEPNTNSDESNIESLMLTPHIATGNFLKLSEGGAWYHIDKNDELFKDGFGWDKVGVALPEYCGDGRIALIDWAGMIVHGYKTEFEEYVSDSNTSIYELDGNDESNTNSNDSSESTTVKKTKGVDAKDIRELSFSKSFNIHSDNYGSGVVKVALKQYPGADPENPDDDILDYIQEKLEEFQTSISIHTTTITTLTELTETHETTITELQTTITELQTTITELLTSITELTQTVSTHTSQITAIQQSITNLQSEIETLSTTVETHETEITTLQSTITSIQESITSLQTTIESHTTSISTLQRQYSEIEQSVTALTTRISNVETSITSLQTSVSTISGTVQQIQLTVSSLATAVYEIQQTLSSLQSTVSGHTSSITYIQQSIGSGGGSGGWGGGVGSVTYSPVTFSPASPSFSAPTLSQSGQLTIPYYTNPQAVLSYISSLIAKINTLESSYQTLQTRIHTLETQVQQMDPAKYDYEEAEVVTNVECVNNEIQVTKTEVTLMTLKENGGAE